jgi:hypothetical protein
MATLAEVSRQRKEGLKRLKRASLALDASQEKVEREVNRLLSRKRSVPEQADMSRVLALIQGTATALDGIGQIAQDLFTSYGV